jgi:Ni,Fe-hydrogenase III small subunit/NAD-dependent dihydropyrimidine dehydrogenase PreA subunit
MLRSLRVRFSQGRQYIGDLRAASPVNFRGLPVIGAQPCADGCHACADACPTAAFTALDPVQIDLGRCILCGDCEPACPENKLTFSNACHTAAVSLQDLLISHARPAPPPIVVSAALRAQFGRSLRLRSVSAGGCNGCESELNAVGNVNFDLGRYGIEFVASPRHADGLVLSGPITRNMAEPLQLCLDAMPQPRFVLAFGACGISGGLFADSPQTERLFLERQVPILYVPGCPPHPLTLVNGLLDLLGIAVP